MWASQVSAVRPANLLAFPFSLLSTAPKNRGLLPLLHPCPGRPTPVLALSATTTNRLPGGCRVLSVKNGNPAFEVPERKLEARLVHSLAFGIGRKAFGCEFPRRHWHEGGSLGAATSGACFEIVYRFQLASSISSCSDRAQGTVVGSVGFGFSCA